MFKKLSLVLVCLLLFAVTPVMAQIDYCEGNFDNDRDQDGTDAFVFKQDFGRSSLLNPCPVIACQTAEQLEMRIAQLEAKLAKVTVSENGYDIFFTGVNVHILNGQGSTATTDWVGNLIVGYNELRGSGDVRTGSHNIVVGEGQNYSSYGGLVAGAWNTVSGPNASVTGGYLNTATANGASVAGGSNNTASGPIASVSGGEWNTASGETASISGGNGNEATGHAAHVSGGAHNLARGGYSFVGGGGGYGESDGNRAYADFSAVLGGSNNNAGIDSTIGMNSCVGGGSGNATLGNGSFVAGGQANVVAGYRSSIVGGQSNSTEAGGDFASIIGGNDNEAGGVGALVAGGRSNKCNAVDSGVFGGWNNSIWSDAHDCRAVYGGGYYEIGGGTFHDCNGCYGWDD